MANLAPRILNIVAIAGIALAAAAALPQARGDAPVRLGAPPPAFENGNFIALSIYGHNFNATPPFSTLTIAPA